MPTIKSIALAATGVAVGFVVGSLLTDYIKKNLIKSA